MKLVTLVVLPPGVATLILPVLAFAGTFTVIMVFETTWNDAAKPLKVTSWRG